MIGTRLAQYEITSHLGSGGMGEVYQAKDLKLGRKVAVKVLPEAFAGDHDRIARFEREAKILASLNHPNIASLYGLEEAGGRHVLVMELVEGDTLAARIERGPFAVGQALDFAQQIAEALEAAHEKGIVHRDLKPANVKLASDGKVKVLDFGLAKAMDHTPASVNVSNSPTLTAVATQGGVILGTAAYMSPEQARGDEADARSDCFSFGCVLYEMLSGRRAFQGRTSSDILASVLAREPDFALLPPTLHPRLLALLHRCFEKEPRQRWQAIGDVRLEVETIRSGGATIETPTQRSKPLWQRALPLAGTALAGAAITAAALWSRPPAAAAPTTTRFSIAAADATASIDALTISPDGSQIVYAMNKRLYLRPLTEPEARPIPGSEFRGNLGGDPDFSPDGRWIIFIDAASFDDVIVKRIAPSGGTPDTVYRGPYPSGLNWGEGGIVFWAEGRGLVRLSPSGGEPELLTSLKDTRYVGRPEVLPGGEVVLLAQYSGQDLVAKIIAQPLKSGESKTLIERGGEVRYLSSGHIVYNNGGTLAAVAFDADRLEVSGEPVPVVEGVRIAGVSAFPQFDVSDNGSLIYLPGPISGGTEATLALVDRNAVSPLALPPDLYRAPRLSPDGTHIAYGLDLGKESNVYIYDLQGKTSPRRLTLTGANRYPIWMGNDVVAFQSDRDGDLGIFSQRADGSDSAARLTRAEKDDAHIPDSWSPVAQALSYTVTTPTTSKVWWYSLRDKKPALLAESPLLLARSVFSPDGRWLAYHAYDPNASGKAQVFVQAFPTGARHQIAASTLAHSPLWSRDGRELFYIYEPAKLASVRITTTPSFTVGNPVQHAFWIGDLSPLSPRMYDVTSSGRFLTILPAATRDVKALHVVLNWFEEVKQRVSGK
jgi:serine/threonine-protein kinase